MAKTVDELVLKMTVEGTAQVKDSTTQMNNLDAATKKTADTMKQSQGNIRNVAFQIQDLSVQIAGGTSAFVALGQQLPQLLGGFGVMGAVVGAVAAVAIPLLNVGLKAAGIDMRNLDERTKDLTDSVKNYQSAQQANLPTLQGLGNTYGTLTGEAKAFFDIQQKLTEQKANAELSATLQKLKKDYSSFTDEAMKAAEAQSHIGAADPATLLFIGNAIRAWNLGLTAEQAKHVGEELKNIDKASPEEAAQTLNNILNYLKDNGVEASKFKKFFDETVDPILKVNNQLLEMKKSMTENARQASDLNAEMIGIQNSFQPDINAARRSFDQIGAARKEGEMKIAEFRKQLDEKTSKDQVDRSKELAAFTVRTQQDVADKTKDVAKNQYESYRSSMLTNDARLRQLETESNILDIQDKGRYGLAFNVKYEEDAARAAATYENTLYNIHELRRKAVINAEQEGDLRKQAMNIQKAELANAEQTRTNAVKAFVESQDLSNMKKAFEEQTARAQKLGDAIRSINDQQRNISFEKEQMGRSPFERQMATIQESARKAGLEASRAFAAGFEDGGDGLTPEKAQELADGLEKIREGYAGIESAQLANLEASRTWNQGWQDAFNEYKDNAFNSASQAKTVFDTFTGGMEDAIVRFAMTGKLSFKDLANSIIADIIRIQVRRSITGLFGGGSLLSGLFGMAAGGPTDTSPIIVGERGPELFIPNGAGRIVPNNQLGGQTVTQVTNVNYSINAVDAASFKSLVARDPQFIYQVTEKGRRSQPTRSRA